MNTRTLATATGIALLALTLSACGSDDGTSAASTAATPTQAATEQLAEPKTSATAKASPKSSAKAAAVNGSYIGLDAYEASKASFASGNVVLFFNASWCSTCQEAEKNLNASGVPEGLTVVKVDYDSNTDLRKKYGVTVQHTFVQVDPDGNQLAKWSGSNTAEAIKSKTV